MRKNLWRGIMNETPLGNLSSPFSMSTSFSYRRLQGDVSMIE